MTLRIVDEQKPIAFNGTNFVYEAVTQPEKIGLGKVAVQRWIIDQHISSKLSRV